MKYFFIISLGFLITACSDDGYLRGHVEPSKDGKTYFGVLDDNGGNCGPLLLDGNPWELPLGEVALIEPGEHILHCGASVSFVVLEGTVFQFDYWGP